MWPHRLQLQTQGIQLLLRLLCPCLTAAVPGSVLLNCWPNARHGTIGNLQWTWRFLHYWAWWTTHCFTSRLAMPTNPKAQCPQRSESHKQPSSVFIFFFSALSFFLSSSLPSQLSWTTHKLKQPVPCLGKGNNTEIITKKNNTRLCSTTQSQWNIPVVSKIYFSMPKISNIYLAS